MKKYKAKDFANRDELEKQIALDLGKTTNKKDAIIVGTTEELKAVNLGHGQSVWGINTEASDFKKVVKVKKPERGPRYESAVNKTKD